MQQLIERCWPARRSADGDQAGAVHTLVGGAWREGLRAVGEPGDVLDFAQQQRRIERGGAGQAWQVDHVERAMPQGVKRPFGIELSGQIQQQQGAGRLIHHAARESNPVCGAQLQQHQIGRGFATKTHGLALVQGDPLDVVQGFECALQALGQCRGIDQQS